MRVDHIGPYLTVGLELSGARTAFNQRERVAVRWCGGGGGCLATLVPLHRVSAIKHHLGIISIQTLSVSLIGRAGWGLWVTVCVCVCGGALAPLNAGKELSTCAATHANWKIRGVRDKFRE